MKKVLARKKQEDSSPVIFPTTLETLKHHYLMVLLAICDSFRYTVNGMGQTENKCISVCLAPAPIYYFLMPSVNKLFNNWISSFVRL